MIKIDSNIQAVMDEAQALASTGVAAEEAAVEP